ncbi:MAG TPA: DUF523 domain-containing protein [Candidatus Limiplasma pullicola]|nr:DUF523 domain-containing protein [Candidatus Limiplasma pullicola]
MNVLVSACLMGFRCRYDGGTQRLACLDALRERHVLIPVCPEVMGGLPTPREPSEIRDGRVMSRDGRDVTLVFLRGAQEAARLAQACGCECALLKERSPSCGLGKVYDGTFTGTLTEGDGVCARLLTDRGVRVIGESGVEELLKTES